MSRRTIIPAIAWAASILACPAAAYNDAWCRDAGDWISAQDAKREQWNVVIEKDVASIQGRYLEKVNESHTDWSLATQRITSL